MCRRFFTGEAPPPAPVPSTPEQIQETETVRRIVAKLESLPPDQARLLASAAYVLARAAINKQGAMYFVNQNSREPVTEPDEMVPLWKILHKVGADWTYGTKGWAAENYCMFLADDAGWKHIVEVKAKAVDDLGCKYWVNTE